MQGVDDVSGKVNLDLQVVRVSSLPDLNLMGYNRIALMQHADVGGRGKRGEVGW